MSEVGRGRKIRKRLGQLVTVLLFGVAGLLVAGLWVVPRVTTIETLTVFTGSMAPAIPEGSVVFIRPPEVDAIEVGEVITFHPPSGGSTLVTHRVTEVASDAEGIAFRTKGDNNRTEDAWLIPERAVVGEVIFDFPYLGHLANRSSSKAGSVLMVGIPLALFAGMHIHTLYTELRPRRRRIDGDGDSDSHHIELSEATEPHAHVEQKRDAHGTEAQDAPRAQDLAAADRVVVDA